MMPDELEEAREMSDPTPAPPRRHIRRRSIAAPVPTPPPAAPVVAERELPRPVRPEYISLEVAAGYTSLCSRTIRRAIAAGELTGFRFGKALRVKLADVDAWADSKAVRP